MSCQNPVWPLDGAASRCTITQRAALHSALREKWNGCNTDVSFCSHKPDSAQRRPSSGAMWIIILTFRELPWVIDASLCWKKMLIIVIIIIIEFSSSAITKRKQRDSTEGVSKVEITLHYLTLACLRTCTPTHLHDDAGERRGANHRKARLSLLCLSFRPGKPLWLFAQSG